MLAAAVEVTSNKQLAKAVKSISFKYAAPRDLPSLLEHYRQMCNYAIRIAITEKPRSRFNLIELAYPHLKTYGVNTHYILSACEVAYSLYRNKNRKSVPYVSKAFLKLDSQSYKLDHLLLRIPVSPRHFIFLTLIGSDYHISYFDDPSLKRGSITITNRTVTIAFSKVVAEINPLGFVGTDINERNITISATDGYVHVFPELGEVVELKERYKEIGGKIRRERRGKTDESARNSSPSSAGEKGTVLLNGFTKSRKKSLIVRRGTSSGLRWKSSMESEESTERETDKEPPSEVG